jgi:RNA polymerase sigma factor (TIGR02999 family)
MSDVSHILAQLQSNDPAAVEQLLPLVYEELRGLAAAKLAQERPGQTLQPTALVHEAFLRLLGSEERNLRWDGRGHFFAAAAEAMRRILVESARRKRAEKHGGGLVRVDFTDDLDCTRDDQLLDVDEALDRLAMEDSQVAAVVKMRYFAGLSIQETAAALGISVRTANRHWAYAKAWLYQDLRNSD